MVASFPLAVADLADVLKVASAIWQPLRFEETSGLGTSEFLTSELAPPVWVADVQGAPVPLSEMRQLQATVDLLDGSLETFLFYSPESAYPQADPDGTILGASTVQIHTVGLDNKTLRLKGLPAGYVVTKGDMIGVTYSTSRRGLFRAAQTVTADGSGVTPTLEVRPHLRPGMAADDAVELVKPAAKVKIVTGSLSVEIMGQVNAAIRFQVRQTLAA